MGVPGATFTGNPQFAAPRSYYWGVAIGYGPGATISRTGNIVQVHQNFSGGFIDSYITLWGNFVTWSSNRYTLDRIFIDQYSYINGVPTPLIFSCNIGYGPNPTNGGWCCTLAYSGGTDYYFTPLPYPPPDYWLPPQPDTFP